MTDCETCDKNRWIVKRFPQIRDESSYWNRQVKQLLARIAILESDAEFERFKDRTDVAWLQAKVVSQQRELKRLNDQINERRIREGLDPLADVAVTSVTAVEVASVSRSQDGEAE